MRMDRERRFLGFACRKAVGRLPPHSPPFDKAIADPCSGRSAIAELLPFTFAGTMERP